MTSCAHCILVVVVSKNKMASHSGGGFTCCVPGCFSNSKRDVNLSFYGFPKEKNLRKRWLHKISRKNFSPSTGHRVCSLHFEGGQKNYMNNVAVIFPLAKSHPRPSLEHDLAIFKFGLRRFKDSDKDMSYYTGLTYGQFVALFKFLNAYDICHRLNYWGSDYAKIQLPDVKRGDKSAP